MMEEAVLGSPSCNDCRCTDCFGLHDHSMWWPD